ncbi:MAG: metallophosphoesterase family protein [Planctomycetota bacterium]
MPDPFRILCFSDLHRDRSAALSICQRADQVDLVIGAGDFANRHQGLNDTLSILSSIETASILVPGNGETDEALTLAAKPWQSACVLHGRGTTLPSLPWSIWGVGGGIPITPFGAWSYDFDEIQGATMLAECAQDGILVTHSPPIDSVDHDSSGRIRGSQSIRDAIERCQPVLAVCGHIHSDWTKHDRIGKTLVLNAGPSGIIVEIRDGHASLQPVQNDS